MADGGSMKRQILTNLLNWKEKKNRKPLLLMGVRQVGKTFALQRFGESAFTHYYYVNFEHHPELAQIFEQNLNPDRILSELGLFLKRPIEPHDSLVILDEIQACPKALTSLKYFNENKSEQAVCAAGSLLGLQLTESAFPVGQVDMLDLSPMTFVEFLMALGEDLLVEVLNNFEKQPVFSSIAHQRLWDLWKFYLIVGGLPEVVALFVEARHDLFTAFKVVRQRQRELIKAYHADIAKHAGNVNAMHIARTWQQVAVQLAQTQTASSARFQFKGIVPGIDRYQRLAGVIDWLAAAQLVIKVPVVYTSQLPLMAYTKESMFKLFMFDVGILGAMADLPVESIYGYDYGTYKGYVAENYVAQALRAEYDAALYTWQENRSKIEFLRQVQDSIVPIEVKSGTVVKAKSLQAYVRQYQPACSLVLSAKPFSSHVLADSNTKAYQCPLYCTSVLPWPALYSGTLGV